MGRLLQKRGLYTGHPAQKAGLYMGHLLQKHGMSMSICGPSGSIYGPPAAKPGLYRGHLPQKQVYIRAAVQIDRSYISPISRSWWAPQGSRGWQPKGHRRLKLCLGQTEETRRVGIHICHPVGFSPAQLRSMKLGARYWHTPVGCILQLAESRAEQPARRIPAGSGGC